MAGRGVNMRTVGNEYLARSISVAQNEKALQTFVCRASVLAEWTGLEPATPGVTGRYSNQLNYHSMMTSGFLRKRHQTWRPLGDSNPCNHRERVVS